MSAEYATLIKISSETFRGIMNAIPILLWEWQHTPLRWRRTEGRQPFVVEFVAEAEQRDWARSVGLVPEWVNDHCGH